MNRVIIIILVLIFFSKHSLANIDTLKLSDNNAVAILNQSEFQASDFNTNLAIIQKIKDWKILSKATKLPPNKAIWLHFFVKNTTDTSQKYFIRNPDNELCDYYILKNGIVISEFKNGEFISTFGMDENQVLGVNNFKIEANSTIEIYLKTSNYQGLLHFLRLFSQKKIRVSYYIYSEKKYGDWLNKYYAHNLNELQVRAFYQGGLGIIFAIILLIYLGNKREKLYKYYLYYVLSAFAFSLIKSRNFTYIGKIIGYFPIIKFQLAETIIWLGFASYLFFTSELLDLHKTNQKFHIFINKVGKVFIFYGIFIFFWLILTNDSGLQAKLFIITRIPILVLYIGILYFTARKIKSSMVKYVVLSNILLIIFGVIAWIKAGFLNDQHWYGIFNHLFTLPFAILLEIIVFALAIAKKIGDDRKLKSEIEKKAIEVEMMALRSQMNPHFIFNSLNSVRYFILSDQKEKAKDYLSKFSKLLRTILNYSKENTISLTQELEASKLYLDVELGRSESNFNYSLEIDENIETDSIQIPPLLLQPFIENGIIHGLRNSEKEEKTLQIKVSQTSESVLEISIIDNGIGRKQAAEIQATKHILHKSLGTEITNKRIELYSQSFPNKINIFTKDLENQSGTQILVLINI